MLGHLGNMHGKCPMSDRYFKLCLGTKIFYVDIVVLLDFMLSIQGFIQDFFTGVGGGGENYGVQWHTQTRVWSTLGYENFEIHSLWYCFWWLLRPCSYIEIIDTLISIIIEFLGKDSQGGYLQVPILIKSLVYNILATPPMDIITNHQIPSNPGYACSFRWFWSESWQWWTKRLNFQHLEMFGNVLGRAIFPYGLCKYSHYTSPNARNFTFSSSDTSYNFL